MNNGFFGFPSADSEGTYKLTVFDSSGAYMILPGTKRLHIFAVGGGGGGGGGLRSTGTITRGGGGGGGGGIVITQYNVEDLGGIGVSLIINIGAGGVGGAGGATDGAAGANGSGSGSTQIYVSGKPGILMNAVAGLSGNGSTSAVSGAPTASTSFVRYNFPPISTGVGVSGGGGGGIFGNPTSIPGITLFNHGGQGGGGRGTIGGAGAGGSFTFLSNGNFAVVFPVPFGRGAGPAGLPANSPASVAGIIPLHLNGAFSPGVGGVGGGSGFTSAATSGGPGYRGGGGGGGGGATTGLASGAGGGGGNGYVAIYAVI